MVRSASKRPVLKAVSDTGLTKEDEEQDAAALDMEWLSHYISAYSVISQGVIVMGPGFRVRYANPQAVALLRCTDPASIEQWLLRAIDAETRARCMLEVEAQRGTVTNLCRNTPAMCYPRLPYMVASALPGAPHKEWVLTLSDAEQAVEDVDPHAHKARQFDAVREEVRTTIARELHDGVGQALTLMRLEIATLRNRVKDVVGVDDLEESLSELHQRNLTIASALRAAMLGLRNDVVLMAGLIPACEQLVKISEAWMGCKTVFQVSPDWGTPDEGMANHFYRSLQEILNNIGKHANAGFFRVRFYRQEATQAWCMEVFDDGKGFPVDGASSLPYTHIGLRSLQERAAIYGGQLILRSRPDIEGFMVTLVFPMNGTAQPLEYVDERFSR